MTDSDLIAACIKSPASRALAAVIVNRFSLLVHKVINWTLRRYGLFSNQNMEDLFQDLFCSLFDDGQRVLRSYDPGRGQATTFFAALARNRSINFCKKARIVSTVDPDWIEDEQFSPYCTLLLRERQEALNRAVETLTCRDRLFYRLYFAELMPIEDIAVVMGTGKDTVYSQRAKIVAKLRSAVAHIVADPVQGRVTL